MHLSRSQRGFTLAELIVVAGIVGALSLALVSFASSSFRFAARNLATNHSHESARLSALNLLTELRNSGSAYRLVDFTGSAYTDVTSVGGSEVDDLSGKFVGTRANAVRFRKLVAGPLRLTANTTPTSTTLTFDFSTGNPSGYRPVAGDKVVLPLITREFDITAVNGSIVTVSPAVGFTLNTVSPNVITGFFYRRVAFSVAENELRYHPDFNGANRAQFRVVRAGVTSPKPFSLLYTSAGAAQTDRMSLRVSLEITDLEYSEQGYGNGTTTLHTTYTPRVQPPAIISTN